MTHNPLFFLVPVLVGLLQPVIWQMNVRFSNATGDMEAATALHIVGFAWGMLLIACGLRGDGGFAGLAAVPWWAWLAGVIGVSGMAAITRAIPEIGISSALAGIVAAQFIAGLVVEHYGLMGADVRAAIPSRWLGAALLAAGAWLISR